MNIHELDSYNLADAVKFNEKLNPRIWQGDKMKAPVRAKLLQIAEDFKQSLGLSDLEVKDITVSGSNAGYTYTPNSDIDLHLVVDLPQADSSEVYRELFDAKKFQYNEMHNITIGGYDVELYVENANEPPVSQGMYSVVKDDWINIPLKKRSTVNDNAVKSKYDVMKHRIESAIASKNFKRISNTAAKIKKMRQAGLDAHGELGPENLAYKMLRTQGVIGKLYDARTAARDKQLSLKEQPQKPRVKYGFREDVGITPDGVSPSTKMFLSETDDEQTVSDFIKDTAEFLGIERLPKIHLHSDAEWGEQNQSFGRFDPETHELHVNLANRHIMDVLRTTAHELAHCRQHEISELPYEAGETGSPWENEAHAVAGIVMRNYADKHPEMFQGVDLNENASGYIPKNKKEAKDPRYSMAVTADIKPGQVGKEANKLGLQTDKQGKPALLIKSANLLKENRDGLFNWLKQQFPTWPDYVLKDFLYQQAKGIRDHAELEDFLKRNKQDFGQVKWRLEKLPITLDIFTPKTQRMIQSREGGSSNPFSVPRDAERHAQQLKMIQQQGVRTEPIIVAKLDNGYDLIEGWHRTIQHLKAYPQGYVGPAWVGYGATYTSVAEDKDSLAESLLGEFKLFEQDLFEVKMTSKNLAKLAKDIPGVKVGLEFEMIVPNAKVDDEDADQEPDYDYDERVRDIDDAINFFDDGDHNYGSVIRRTREEMESNFFDWQHEQIDEAWDEHGFEFFTEYLDREEPFDPTDYEDDVEDDLKAEYPDLDPESDEFEELKSQKLQEIEANYYTETWAAQGRSYDRAREEFEEEQRDSLSEQDWLESQGIRYASDVQNEYTDLTWPYWTTFGGDDGEADIERVALDFMNGIGANTVAYSSSYHGSYKKWTGDGWVLVGSEKPDDCFSIEPDGSLDGNSDDDVGLEFVSPPIPLEDIGTVMKKVQNWAGEYGVYTGKNNKTSIHTNISVPGYDLDKLDYLKAALLLGDEHVLREFDRIGNTYAKPAIEKVKQLVQQKPEKAKELLDKMKGQLEAAASKLIHSGVTDKFTSINTKNNRVEFRSPGGDYLSIIADNPQKMVDTINRMVVTLDAAMDPNKYKEEYQKKLYKLLTGDLGSRTAKSGDIKYDITSKATIWNKDTRRQEPAFKATADAATAKEAFTKARQLNRIPEDSKMSEYNVTPTSVTRSDFDKDLLKYFTQYAAGELPKAALKSFVRQAQLERKVAQQKDKGVKMWWNVARDGQRMEVVATNEMDAKLIAAKEWGIVASDANLSSMTVKPLRPYDDTAGGSQVVAQQPTTPQWGVWDVQQGGFVNSYGGVGSGQGRLIGGDTYDAARNSARNNGLLNRLEGGEFEIRQIPQEQPTPSTTDAIRQAVGRNIAAQSAQNQGNWGIWMQNADRFANQPGEYPRGATPPLYRFPSREAAEQWIEQQRADRPNMRTDIEVREIEPAQALPDIFPELPQQQAAGEQSSYELYRISDGRTVTAPAGNPIVFRATDPADAESKIARYAADFNLGAPELFAVRSVLQVPAQQSSDAAQGGIVDVAGGTEWDVVNLTTGQTIGRVTAADQNSAEDAAGSVINQFLATTGYEEDDDYGVRPATQPAATAPQTLTRPGQPQQQFTGEWKIVMPDGREVYRFGGVGNAQADANRVAMDWLMRNRQYMQSGAEVLPVMGEA